MLNIEVTWHRSTEHSPTSVRISPMLQRRFSHLRSGNGVNDFSPNLIDTLPPEGSLHVEAMIARPKRVAVVMAERALVRIFALDRDH